MQEQNRECENLSHSKYAGSRLKRACLDSDDTTKRTRTCDDIIADFTKISNKTMI